LIIYNDLITGSDIIGIANEYASYYKREVGSRRYRKIIVIYRKIILI